MDTGNVSEILGLGPDEEISDMAATHEATGQGIEFHVSMHGHTMRDMEELIVQAAAQMIVGRHNDRELAKKIEAQCIALIDAKAKTALDKVTTEIIDQPLIPAYGDKKPVTMREFIGLTGREYLSERVDYQGNVQRDGYRYSDNKTRMEFIVGKYMEAAFKKEIEAATNAVAREIRAAVEASHKAFIEAEKNRFREALEKVTA